MALGLSASASTVRHSPTRLSEDPFLYWGCCALRLACSRRSRDAVRIGRWAFHPGAIRSRHVICFLAALRHHVRRRVVLLWDGLPAHRSRAVEEALIEHRAWLTIVRLPAYAPELNPVEQLWAHFDATALANTPPDDLRILRHNVRNGLRRVRRHPDLAWGFLRHTGLF